MTNVVAISRAKNEADIIEAWVRHTVTHVDRVIVSENDSTDDTAAILQALVDEGLPITVLKESTIGDYQASIFTRMMREVAPAADWIVPLDTDEFIETTPDQNASPLPERDEGGKPTTWPRLADLLAQGPTTVRALPWQSMAWSSANGCARDINPVVYVRDRLIEETFYQKVCVPSAVAMSKTLCTGSHFMLPDGDRGTLVPHARLCHFPLRSVDQYKLKACIAYLQSACVPGWDRKTGFQFGAIPDIDKIDEEALAQYSRRYASHNPPEWQPRTIDQPLDYRGGPLRYTKPVDRFIPTLLRYAETLALGIASRDTAGQSFAVNR